MTEIGEKTGRLDAIFKSLGAYYKQNDDLTGEIKSAVAYPVIMLLVILAVIYVLFTLVMPVFDRVYESLGVGNAMLLSKLLSAGYILNTVALVIGGVIILIILCIGVMSVTAKGREALADLFNNSFLTRSLSAKLSAHRFAYAMSVMLSGGLSFDSAIELSGEITANRDFRKKVKRLRYFLDNGESFAEAVSKSAVFESAYNGMISASARAGQTDATLMVIAKRYEENVNRKIGDAVAAVEPALVALLSVIVGLVLMSVVVPLVGIMSTML
jgi:type IV pilus assembly protein PilC